MQVVDLRLLVLDHMSLDLINQLEGGVGASQLLLSQIHRVHQERVGLVITCLNLKRRALVTCLGFRHQNISVVIQSVERMHFSQRRARMPTADVTSDAKNSKLQLTVSNKVKYC